MAQQLWISQSEGHMINKALNTLILNFFHSKSLIISISQIEYIGIHKQ